MHQLFYRFLLFSLIPISACHTQHKTATSAATATPMVSTPPLPATMPSATPIAWTQKMVDLGAVTKGEKKTTQFEFTNTSGVPLKIYHVDACECTTVEFPRGIIPAGEKRRLDVIFDSAQKEEPETISINVFFEKPAAPDEPKIIEVVQYKYVFKA
jgi:hypothetical protein